MTLVYAVENRIVQRDDQQLVVDAPHTGHYRRTAVGLHQYRRTGKWF